MDTSRTAYYIDAANPGTELAGETAAALAAASIVFKASNPAYSALCLMHATQVHIVWEISVPIQIPALVRTF